MNILPLVFVYMMIFALLATSSFKQISAKHDLFLSLKGSWNVFNALNNEIEKRTFLRLPEDKKEKAPSSLPSKKTKKSIRESLKFSSDSKLSLSSLKNPLSIQEKVYLQNAFESLLSTLYKGTSLESEVETKKRKLTIALFEKVKEGKWEKGALLSSLKLQDESLHLLFYKLCLGTSAYITGKKEGYPSLEYFVTLEDFGKNKALYFHTASFAVLAAFFGDEAAQAVLASEKEAEHRALSQTELSTLLNRYGNPACDPTILSGFVSFNKEAKSPFPIRIEDKKSHAFCEFYPD